MTSRATCFFRLRIGPGRSTRSAVAVAGAALFVAADASPASAHGIGGDAATTSILGFVGIGIEHMLLGWDHLLFVAGIVLLAGNARRAVKVVSGSSSGTA
jgi:hydrogenase/urease accessory protein HupE